jgi:hypothetical protein
LLFECGHENQYPISKRYNFPRKRSGGESLDGSPLFQGSVLSVTGPAKNRKQAFRELAQVVAELRQEAKEKGIDKTTKSEVKRAVAWARRDLWLLPSLSPNGPFWSSPASSGLA